LTEQQILAWADAHHTRTGEWPIISTGSIPAVRGETWCAVDHSPRIGRRGMPGGSSLAQLLEARRGVRNVQAACDLTVEQVLPWAYAYRSDTGSWPTRLSGPIEGRVGETWSAVAQALIARGRGFPERTSLAQILARHRGARNHMDVPSLSEVQILKWADAHYAKTGKLPSKAKKARHGLR
jgi:hypothetical protein